MDSIIDSLTKKFQNFKYDEQVDFEFLLHRNNIYDEFIKILNSHNIIKYFQNLNIEFTINYGLIFEIINNNIETLDRNSNILIFHNKNYIKKNKKIKRFLLKFIKKKSYKRNPKKDYIKKLELGYITTCKLKKKIINYIVNNDLIVSVNIDIVLDILESKTKKIKNTYKLFEFIKNSINEFYYIFSNDTNKQLLVLNISNNINLLAKKLNPYIKTYNSLQKNNLDKLPFISNFKNNNSQGYYYKKKFRDFYWDYNNIDNWNLIPEPFIVIFRISDNVKYNTLISLYHDLINNNIDKITLLDVINNYKEYSKSITGNIIPKLKIRIEKFLEYCQEYYTFSIQFKLFFKIFTKNKKIHKIKNFIIEKSYDPKYLFGQKMILWRLKNDDLENIIV